jgi:DNA repair protein RecO (recombination protein O)
MEFTETVLVLQVGRFRETDVWVRFFSPSKGVRTGFAFGGSRSRRRFSGCLDACNQVRFHVKVARRGEYLNLVEGDLVKAPQRLRHDWRRMGVAANCLKFLEAVMAGAPGPEIAAPAYELARETLDALDAAEEISPVFPLFFRARVAFGLGLGYAPSLDSCSGCGAPAFAPCGEKSAEDTAAPAGLCFLVEEGRALCPSCKARTSGFSLPLGPASLRTLTYVCERQPADWTLLRPEGQERRECAALVDHFVRFHLGLAWDNGRFQRV